MSDENAEEQEMELEAMESIYDEDYTLISADPPHYTIRLVPVPEDEAENHVGVVLDVTYHAAYPQEACKVDLTVEKGLSNDQADELRSLIMSTAEELVGDTYMFSVAQAVKDWLEEHNEKPSDGSMHSIMMARIKKEQAAAAAAAAETKAKEEAEAAEAEGKRPTGTVCTPESFAAWWATFKEERDAGKTEEVAVVSGRQLFERDSKMSTSDAAIVEAAAKAAKAAAMATGSGTGSPSAATAPAATAAGAGGGAGAAGAAGAGASGTTAVQDESLFLAGDDLDDLDDLDLDDD